LSQSNASSVTVNFTTQDTTALAGSDYLATNGLVTFPPGVTNQTIAVAILGDLLNETNETFRVVLSNPVNATLADAQAIGTIVNDDPLPTLQFTNASYVEGNVGTSNVVFNVNLSAPSGRTVSVNYGTVSNSATAGIDYVIKSGTLTFAAGVTNTNIVL